MRPFLLDICKMRRTIFPVFILCILTACSSNRFVNARVYERREIEDNRLMIKYSYSVTGKTFLDSAAVKNKVMEGDTIRVSVDYRNPGKSKPAIDRLP